MKKRILLCRMNIIILILMAAVQVAFTQDTVAFHDRHGSLNYAIVDLKTGSVKRILGLSAGISDYGLQKANFNKEAVQEIGRNLLRDYSEILKLSVKDVSVKKIDTDGNWWFADYTQSVAGIPVFGTEIGFTIDPQGRVVTLGTKVYPHINCSTTPSISSDSAVALSKQGFGKDSSFTHSGPVLGILPEESDTVFSYHLVWRVEILALNPVQSVIYFISADDGKILRSMSNMKDLTKSSVIAGNYTYSGTVTGNYWPVRTYDATVNGPFQTTNIKFRDHQGNLVATVSSDANGYYSISDPAGLQYSIHIPLKNNWIKIFDKSNYNNPVPVEYWNVVIPGTTNYDWPADDGPNVRYHASLIHDYFSNHFNYSGMDYQMSGYINGGPGMNGRSDGSSIFFGSQNGLWWARSSDIVYHEYTHNVVYQIYGGWIGTFDFDCEANNDEPCAMNEGFPDYFAGTINNSPVIGNDVGVTRYLNYGRQYSDLDGNLYDDDPIIAGACWDLRQDQTVLPTIADNLVFKALQVTPHAYCFADFLDNLYIADNGTYSGAHHAQIQAAFAKHGIMSQPVVSRWNLLSVPNVVADYHKSVLYPNSSSSAWTFNGGLVSTDPLSSGVGFWLKFGAAQNIHYLGSQMNSKTVNVSQGWNIIGSLSQPLDVAKVQQNAGGIATKFFGYDNGYYVASSLQPGKGYWVKVNSNGTLTLDLNSQASNTLPPVQEYPPSFSGTPDPPTLSAPSNGATGQSTSPTLSWNTASGATSYRLQVSTNTDFTTLLFDQAGLNSTSQAVGGLSYSTTYYWHVNSANSEGSGTWSSNWSFTTQAPAAESVQLTVAVLGRFQTVG
jgi:Zn-dependent metalloprotease